jgi:hypothetical protein
MNAVRRFAVARPFDAFIVRCSRTPDNSRAGVDEVRCVVNTMVVAGPERWGSARGVPVPSSTICVRLVAVIRDLSSGREMRGNSHERGDDSEQASVQ